MIRLREILMYPIAVPNLSYLRILVKRRIDRRMVSYKILRNSIYLKRLGIEVSLRDKLFLLEGLDIINNLIDQYGAEVKVDTNRRVVVRINGMEFNVNSWEELKILDEIYCKGVYNVQLQGDFTVIDVGMNVALTSLFFASKENVNCVYSYEPFTETFNLGLRNIRSNPEVAAKIHAFNYGLGERTEEIMVDYLAEFKGSVGVKGIPRRIMSDKLEGQVRQEKIRLMKADEVFAQILKQHQSANYVAKIDCEGSEYEILPLLDSGGILGRLHSIILEWHQNGPEELVRILMKNGFVCLSFDSHRADVGMIYGLRKS